MKPTYYFSIYSNTSRNGFSGLRPQVMLTNSETIINAAAREMERSGETLEDMAGIDWIENADGNLQPSRELTSEEVIALSVAKLGDDGRMYKIFNTDEPGAKDFIFAADAYGLGDQAKEIVKSLNS